MITLLVGLGNPGQHYSNSRHNAGQWFINALKPMLISPFRFKQKLKAQITMLSILEKSIRVAMPTCYMNHSGQSVSAILKFYKITSSHMLVAHDDIDLPAGMIKLKFGGKEAGHNGLRSIVSCIGDNKFYRLRIGVSRPNDNQMITNYVLGVPNCDEKLQIDQAIARALVIMPEIISQQTEKAMNYLHCHKKTTQVGILK